MLLLWIYIVYRGHLELEKRKVANTIKSTHWSGKHTVISLQKSYNGRKHNNKVALSLGEFAAYVEQKQPSSQDDFLQFFFFFFLTSYTRTRKIYPLVWFQSYKTVAEVNKYFTKQKRGEQSHKDVK